MSRYLCVCNLITGHVNKQKNSEERAKKGDNIYLYMEETDNIRR